jgi:multiple RNA-binding domain-containing protein 1
MVLSMGYGFVQFQKAASVDKALKLLQHKMLDGHCLELKRSNRASTTDDVKTAKKDSAKQTSDQATCKIICRNVPFEANEKEIKDIFQTFGTLKGVRLPKKVTGSHRGFAFVEFLSKEEAKKAFEALCHSTHVYGRRLVLEWAAEEDTIETLRQKTAHHFADGGQPAKRLKKSDFLESLGVPMEEM